MFELLLNTLDAEALAKVKGKNAAFAMYCARKNLQTASTSSLTSQPLSDGTSAPASIDGSTSPPSSSLSEAASLAFTQPAEPMPEDFTQPAEPLPAAATQPAEPLPAVATQPAEPLPAVATQASDTNNSGKDNVLKEQSARLVPVAKVPPGPWPSGPYLIMGRSP